MTVFVCYYTTGMSTYWFDLSLDARGSINLPIEIKRRLNLGMIAPLAVREVNGVIIVVPLLGEAAEAHQNKALEAWVDARLQTALPPAPVASSATVVAEVVRAQRARERHEMRMKAMQMQVEVFRARREAIKETSSPRGLAKSRLLAAAEAAPGASVEEAVKSLSSSTLPQAKLPYDEPDSRRDVLAELGLPQDG